ncbi:NADH-quinone oxidoreductase subunit L [Edaphobacter albus]|uniref:NADH-quinone oxidoreductase subunit L n=1 Tax=Edaphobacter sp. 4G125 TaxID=2763071 RepID=UPI0016491738|nr:NADH-quinone oxidoreductase subunit L [Edaphobacter sp. 4G125]QNI35721.1 NADH-quinone oxidoreductase subunit L [Edaphobacter sp. 4G125]
MPADYLWLIPLLPFAGFLINGTLGRRLPRPLVSAVALIPTFLSASLWVWLWFTMKAAGAPESIHSTITLFGNSWISVSGFHADFAFTVDHLTLIMLGVVTCVGFLIHLYSVGYMAHEEGYWRFFAYLNLFMFFMLVLVLAANFLLLFVGWEGVGLASYLLIGFYFKKDSAADAGKKAFIVNRVGDFGFLLAMFLLIANFGSLDFDTIFTSISQHSEWQGGILTAIALLLVVGATGKSAQIPLYVWLPDAMEGPTPVSALIHAATMVTAGIYMVARAHVIFDRSPYALGVVAIIGAATAIFAACIGMVQHDIKRVLAYSTVSQLGYMFLACGVGAYTAGIFHLLTHAFFKALLFLAAGSVIHALSGEQDMRKMGGLRKRIPVTFWTMTMGVFAIAGIPPLAGFFSKDEILFRAFTSPNPIGKLLWLVGLVTAGMTSFYMFRLWFKTFFGKERFEEHHRDAHHGDHGHAHGVHESPLVMTLPLMVLALLSIIGGWVGVPAALGGHDEIGEFLAPVFSGVQVTEVVSHSTELGLAAVSVLVALLGLFIAYVLYCKKPGTAASYAQKFPALYRLVENKFYVDEIYQALIVTPLLVFSRLILGTLVDGGLVNGSGYAAGASALGLGALVRRVQSGNIRSYAGWLALGAAAVIAVMIFGHTRWLN